MIILVSRVISGCSFCHFFVGQAIFFVQISPTEFDQMIYFPSHGWEYQRRVVSQHTRKFTGSDSLLKIIFRRNIFVSVAPSFILRRSCISKFDGWNTNKRMIGILESKNDASIRIPNLFSFKFVVPAIFWGRRRFLEKPKKKCRF